MRQRPAAWATFAVMVLAASLAAAIAPAQEAGTDYGVRAAAAGDCGVTWTARTSGTAQYLRGVAWTGSQLVAVGDAGTILTSPDGATWTPHTSGTSAQLYGAAWTGSRLVAVGGDGVILTSQDGAAWTPRTSGTTNYLLGVAWTGAQLVAVGDAGAVLTSPDGVTWTSRASGVTSQIFGVAGTPSQLVAGGNPVGPSMTVLSSTDGITWTQHPFSGNGWLGAFTSAGGQFVAVGVVGTVYTSPDGSTWTKRGLGVSDDLSGVAWTGSQLVAVGGGIFTSPDGISWTGRTSGTSSYLAGVVAASSQLVAVGGNGAVVTSPCSAIYPFSTWVPVASHNLGRNGSQFRSDLGLLNPGTVQANVQLKLYNGASPVTTSTYVPAGSQSILTDVVSQLGAGGSWALQVLADQPLKVTARTYNQSATGTFGQDYMSATPDQGLAAGQGAYLPQLTENAAYRSNIGLVNTGAAAASINVELHDGSGTLLATYTVSLNPGDWKQETQPFFNKAHQTAMARGYAKVTVTSGAGVFAVASLIDNATNDPTTIPMLR